ncbi:reverse transcriptase (RNA-dependent DNA polymerase) domain-containing protein [Phthorimaea operculella]|nr:reverse transcriptase (RNA-dependent DNA polymerase) domain-containing protein [Phthorimaea operculella]
MTNADSQAANNRPVRARLVRHYETKEAHRKNTVTEKIENSSQKSKTKGKTPAAEKIENVHDSPKSSPQRQQNPQEKCDNDKFEWKTATNRKKRQRRPVTVGTGAADHDLQTVERLKYILASSFRKNVTKERIVTFLDKHGKRAESSDYSVEERILTYSNHSAFVIGLPESLFTTFMDPSIWPQALERLLDHVAKTGRDTVIIGDINIDLLIESPRRKLLRDTLSVYGFKSEVVNEERGRAPYTRTDYTDVVMKTDGTLFPSKMAVVNDMNLRFVNAATTCGAPTANLVQVCNILKTASQPACESIRFTLFTEQEIYLMLTKRIAIKKTQDLYNISTLLLSKIAIPLSYVLAKLFNVCIVNGSYPKPLKRVKVAPIYKGKGSKKDPNSYRPISIIPGVAKIFECGLSARLTTFLTETRAFTDRQYAYRAGRSTVSLAREVVRRIMTARESRRHVALLCCDLSRAFDVADHTVLTAKLSHYGVRGPALALMCDFMRDRCQSVVGDHGNISSDAMNTEIGVAQGSSLSNITFSLLMNDLPKSVTNCEVYMFADDVAAIVEAESATALEYRLNDVAVQLKQWFTINGLALNISKTQFLRINLSGHAMPSIEVVVDNTIIQEVKVTPFLGFQIDSTLTWSHHIDKLCTKLGQACFALSRIASTLPSDVVRTCYFATVHSLLQYGVDLFGCAADWERVFIMQKRAVRIIARVKSDQSARPHFINLHILTVPCMLHEESVEAGGDFTEIEVDLQGHSTQETPVISDEGDGTSEPNGTLTREETPPMVEEYYQPEDAFESVESGGEEVEEGEDDPTTEDPEPEILADRAVSLKTELDATWCAVKMTGLYGDARKTGRHAAARPPYYERRCHVDGALRRSHARSLF